jgi:hypothetical protein
VSSEYAMVFLSRGPLKGRMLKCVPRHRSPIKRGGACFEVVKLIRLSFSGHHELWSLLQSEPLKDELKLVPPPPSGQSKNDDPTLLRISRVPEGCYRGPVSKGK